MTHKTPFKINLDTAGVPKDASAVIVYAIVQSGYIENATSGALVLTWKTHHGTMERRLFYRTYKQDSWSYNSENMTIPVADMTTRCIEAYIDGPPLNGDSFKATVQLVSFMTSIHD